MIAAHPYLDRSRANAALLRGIEGLPGVAVRRLYDRYPDFSIDVDAEQQALEGAAVIVWQHPLQWYTAPALLKLWFEKVLIAGWAYGDGGDALRGKRCLWVVTTGGEERDYRPAGMHQHRFEEFLPVVRQTAQFCGMAWLEPIVVHGAHHIAAPDLAAVAQRYRARLRALLDARQAAYG